MEPELAAAPVGEQFGRVESKRRWFAGSRMSTKDSPWLASEQGSPLGTIVLDGMLWPPMFVGEELGRQGYQLPARR